MKDNKFSSLDEKFMDAALKEAKKALIKKEVPIGAVVVCKDKIIGRGHNLRETSKDPLAHAEMIAIEKAAKKIGDWRLNDCSLYTTLEPCPMCCGAMVLSRIKNLIYGTDDPKGVASRSLKRILSDKKLNHKVIVIKGLKAKECKDLITNFFKSLRKK